MKKFFPVLALMIACQMHADAQKIYVKVGAGYAFPQAGNSYDVGNGVYGGTAKVVQTVNQEMLEFKVKKASFSAGMQANLGVGIKLNKHFSAEINTIATVATRHYKYHLDETYNAPEFYKTDITTHADMPVMLCPSIVMQTGDVLNIYARGGLVLPLAHKIIIDGHLEGHSPNPNAATGVIDFTQELKTRFNIGFTGAAGVKYKIGNRTALWVEANLISLSLYAKEQRYTNLIADGQNVLGSLTVNQTVTEFAMSNSSTDPRNSNVRPAYSVPFSSFGIQAGISLEL
ncbi:MAG: outer membrane beta-barrel protein [Bacteroidetes bacterium]|nr:outer membrane beta-barrel protein [Bacteroidota bacterium]